MIGVFLKNMSRQLRRQKATALINIGGLAIGMAAAVLIFLWVRNERRYDSYHPGADRIYRVKTFLTVSKDDIWVWETAPYVLGDFMRSELPAIEALTRIEPVEALPVQSGTEYIHENGAAWVDSSWFDLFRYEPLDGSLAGFPQTPQSIVLTEKAARKYFGHQRAVGSSLRIDTADFMVQAVVADNPVHSSFQFDMLLPVVHKLLHKRNELRHWGNFNFLSFVKLVPGTDTAALCRQIDGLLARHKGEDNIEIGLMPLKGMHFEDDLQSSNFEHGNKRMVSIFTVLGVLLLLIACINYVNLTTARASLRIKEVSVRKIVGARRVQLMRQFILESAVLTACALVIGLLLMQLALPYFNTLAGKNFTLAPDDPGLWQLLSLTFAATVLLNSFYPALLLSSFQPMQVFRGFHVQRLSDGLLRKGLVVVQFTISIALIIGVIVIIAQLQFINSRHERMEKEQVLSLNVPYRQIEAYGKEHRQSFVQAFRNELLAQAAITEVSSLNQRSIVNMKGFSSGSADWDGRPRDFNPSIAYFDVDHHFNKIMGLQLLEGAWFGEGTPGGNVILNETAVKQLRLRHPVIGQRFSAQGDTGVIVGVVKDFHYKSLHEKIDPVVIRHQTAYNTTFLLQTSPGDAAGAVAAARRVWKSMVGAVPFDYHFLDEEFDQLYAAEKKGAMLTWVFAGLAILVSCLGLFGLAAFTAERRTKEIGIRKVLGAPVSTILRLLSQEFILLVGVAFLVAAPVAGWAMQGWLQDFAYHIDMKWWMFAAAGGAALLIALATIMAQAWKAAMRNPVNCLRTE